MGCFRKCKDIYIGIYNRKIDNGIQSFKNIIYLVSLSLKMYTHTSLALPVLLLKNRSVSKNNRKNMHISRPCAYKTDTLPYEPLRMVGWLRIEPY